MKKRQVVLCIMFSLVLTAGCGKATEKAETVTEPEIEAVDQIDEPADLSDSEQEEGEAVKAAEADHVSEASEEELEGSVVSINSDEKSVEINEIITEEYEDGSMAAVKLVSAGSSDHLIKVQFGENTRYTLRRVENGGINPEDVSDSEGSFSDMEEGRTILLKGHYEDEQFLAADVVIYDIR